MGALPDDMKAILIDDFVPSSSQLSISRVPLPFNSHLQSSTILIRVTHVSVTHVDLLYFQGKHQNNRRHAKPPFILGSDFSGIIIRVPAGSSFHAGERVFGSAQGAFAEYVTVTVAAEGTLKRVPAGWGLAGACAVGVSGSVSYGALINAGGLRRGNDQTVLVLGAAGGLGVIAVQIAKSMGARVVAVCNTGASQEKVRMLKSIGADTVVGYQEEGWEELVRRATPDGEGVDLVFDSIGAVLSSIKCCKFGGRVVVVGFAARDGIMEEVKVNRVLLKNISLIGFRFGEYTRRNHGKAAEVWNGFMQMVDAGEVQPVAHEESYRGLEDIPRALEDLRLRKVWGRAVVEVAGPDCDNKSRL